MRTISARCPISPRISACRSMRRRFTAGLIRGKLEEEGIADRVEAQHHRARRAASSSARSAFSFVPLAHSIPEGNALLIDTPYGRVFHTGDWKLDDDAGARRRRQRRGADARSATRACWRWSAIRPTSSTPRPRAPKASVRDGPARGGRRGEGARARHHLRVERGAAADARARSRRRPGASCASPAARSTASSRSRSATGYLKDFPETVDLDAAMRLPRDKVMIVATGGQGEARAALARIADGSAPDQARRGRHRRLLLEADPRQRSRDRPHPEPARRQGRSR